MTRKHILPLTYAPKIPKVLSGECIQTIRPGRKYQVGALVMFHGWEDRPYRSKWSFRTPYWKIHTVWDVRIYRDGIVFLERKGGPDYSPEMFRMWPFLDWLAVLDGIDPPTGTELGRVLTNMHKLPSDGLPSQVIRWTFSNETSGGV